MPLSRHRDTSGLVIGRQINGRPFAIPGPADLTHLLAGGETGSGKSSLEAAIGCALADDPTVALVGIDLKLTELAVWRPRLTALATTARDASILLALLVAEMHRRNALMQSHGLRKWDPDLGPWIVVVIDELARLAGIAVEQLITQALAGHRRIETRPPGQRRPWHQACPDRPTGRPRTCSRHPALHRHPVPDGGL